MQLLIWILSLFTEKPSTPVPLPPVPVPVPPPVAPAVPTVPGVEPPRYLWTPQSAAIHSARLICDEEKLTWEEKNIICACIYQESQFNNNAKGLNKKNGVVTSTDWGIVQVNDHYHIGQGKRWQSVRQVLDNPDMCVRWMIRMYKQGELKLWVSYSSGAYKQHLWRFQ